MHNHFYLHTITVLAKLDTKYKRPNKSKLPVLQEKERILCYFLIGLGTGKRVILYRKFPKTAEDTFLHTPG